MLDIIIGAVSANRIALQKESERVSKKDDKNARGRTMCERRSRRSHAKAAPGGCRPEI
jgi:hypothetical protein